MTIGRSGKIRFQAFDALRGVAALAVVMFHFSSVATPWLLPHAPLAVDFFFLLSGYVVAFAYEDPLRSGLPLVAFIKLRLMRLYPLVFIGAIIGLLGYFRVYSPAMNVVILVTGLLLIPTPFAPASEGSNAVPVNPPEWTLVFELFGNIAYAAAVPRLTHRRLVGGIVASFVFYELVFWIYGGQEVGFSWPTLPGGVPRFALSFLLGVGLCRLMKAGKLTRIPAHFPAAAVLLLAVFLCPIAGRFEWLFDSLTVVLVFPVVMLLCAKVQTVGRGIVCTYAGELSYPVYILQGGVVPHVRSVAGRLGLHGLASLPVNAAAVAVYVAFAWLIWRAIDVPIRQWLSGRARASRAWLVLARDRLGGEAGA